MRRPKLTRRQLRMVAAGAAAGGSAAAGFGWLTQHLPTLATLEVTFAIGMLAVRTIVELVRRYDQR